MRQLLTMVLFLLSLPLLAQTDSLARQAVEADRETSFENYELLIIALLGLLILMGLRYWFKRTRKR